MHLKKRLTGLHLPELCYEFHSVSWLHFSICPHYLLFLYSFRLFICVHISRSIIIYTGMNPMPGSILSYCLKAEDIANSSLNLINRTWGVQVIGANKTGSTPEFRIVKLDWDNLPNIRLNNYSAANSTEIFTRLKTKLLFPFCFKFFFSQSYLVC